MSPTSREGSRKREWPTFSGEREEFEGFSQLLVFALSSDGKLGYIAVSDYNPTKPFTFQGREYPPAVSLEGKDSGPDGSTPRAITPRPDDGDDEETKDDGGDDGRRKKKKKRRHSPSGLVVDVEEAARLQKKIETEKADVCYILVSSLPVNYRKLVQGLVCPHAMWKAIEGHFGTRDTTDYASSYTGVFRYRLEDTEQPEMFVQTLDANIITFERVIDTKLSDIFKSMILQHALPASWEYIIRGWLGQAKNLSYVKLMELVSSELKRRRPEGSGQDKGKGEKAYAAVEAKHVGGTTERKCFACKQEGHLVADCPMNPNRGEKVKTSEPPKKKLNTGKQPRRKGTRQMDHSERDHRHGDDRRRDDRRSPPRGQQGSGQWAGGHSGAHHDDRVHRGYGDHGDQRGPSMHYHVPPTYDHGRQGPGHHHIQPYGPGHRSRSPPRNPYYQGYQQPDYNGRGHRDGRPHYGDHSAPPLGRGYSPPRGQRDFQPSRGYANSPPRGRSRSRDRQPGSGHPDERRGRSYDRRGDRSSHNRDSFGTPHFPHDGGSRGPSVRDEPKREQGYFVCTLASDKKQTPEVQWRSEFMEHEKDLIAAHIREKGMASVRLSDGTYEYQFEHNRVSNSSEEEDSDEHGSSGVRVITRKDIIENINKNPKMNRAEKRLVRSQVKKRFDLETRMEAKRRGYVERTRDVRRAARAIRKGDNPENWRKVLGASPGSSEEDNPSEGVFSDDDLKFEPTVVIRGDETESIADSKKQLQDDVHLPTEDKAVADSHFQRDVEAEPNSGQADAAVVAQLPTSEKPAMALVSTTSTLNTKELIWVVDTGATSHMCKNIGLFVEFEPIQSSMETAANPLRILGKGTVKFSVKDSTNAVRTVELKNVNYVPRVAHNLFSVIKALRNDGFKIEIDDNMCTLRHEGNGYVLSAPGDGEVDLYLLNGIGGLDILA